jgi:hypothetical protein
MNPKLVKVATVGAKKVFTNKYVLMVLIILVLLFFFRGRIRKMIKRRREKQFDKNETQDVNQIAQQYRSASNPSGISWMIDFDGTDEEAIDKLAYQSKNNFPAIANAYRQKFDETLTDRMRAELSTEDFQSWHNIIT